MADTLWWALSAVLILIGLAGIVLPALPGTILVLAGIFMGLVGVLFMPLAGAAIGEYMALRDQRRAVKVGIATWLGLMAGMLAKFVLAFVMVGIYVVALLF